eukprot:g3955.t1
MAGGSTVNNKARLFILAIVSLVMAGGVGVEDGRGSGELGPDTVRAQRLTPYFPGVHGGYDEEKEEEEEERAGSRAGGILKEEPATRLAVARAPVVHEAGEDVFVEGRRRGATPEPGGESEVEAEEKGAAAEHQHQQQQQQYQQQQLQLLRQQEIENRLLAHAGRRRYGKRPRRRQAYASSPGVHSIDAGSIGPSQNHGRVTGEALQHARWGAGRCWFDETGLQRCQANVFLFGVSKCGTSSLAAWMAHHPALRWVSNLRQIGVTGEEAHVLDEMGATGFNEMLGEGPAGKYGMTAPVVANETDRVIDYTPHLSIKAEVPYRIIDIYGDAANDGSNKYIATLRDPVARAISSWQSKFDIRALTEDYDPDAEAKHFGETRFLAEAVRQGAEGFVSYERCQASELQRAGGTWTAELKKEVDLERCRLRDFQGASRLLFWAHVAKGMYAMQLERWFSLFGRENVKVLFLEETARDPVGALSEIFEFIGVDLVDENGEKGLPSRQHWEDVVSVIHNETDEGKKRVLRWQVTAELVQSMRKFFAPYNERLQMLLGRPLPENWSLP